MTQIYTRNIAADVIDIVKQLQDENQTELIDNVEEYISANLEEAGLRNRLVIGKFKLEQ